MATIDAFHEFLIISAMLGGCDGAWVDHISNAISRTCVCRNGTLIAFCGRQRGRHIAFTRHR
jgi:hypothetical protein